MHNTNVLDMITKKSLHRTIKFLISLTGPRNAIRLRYFHGFKRFPNLTHPKTFNEKINAYKFMGGQYNFAYLADKVVVKDYVAEKIGAEHVIPTLYAGETLPPRAERTWALPYVIKMNHGSGWNIMVRNEKERNWKEIEKKVSKWLKTTYGKDSGEVHYGKIKPMVLVEKFISDQESVLPKDYKFHMINGKVEFIEVDVDRETKPIYTYYDKNWDKLPFAIEEFSSKKPTFSDLVVPKPINFDKMSDFAKVLSAGLPLARVDFYEVNGQVYFGEMTMTPFAGFCKFYPEKYDYIFGAMMQLN